jgi:hypothetical protein
MKNKMAVKNDNNDETKNTDYGSCQEIMYYVRNYLPTTIKLRANSTVSCIPTRIIIITTSIYRYTQYLVPGACESIYHPQLGEEERTR